MRNATFLRWQRLAVAQLEHINSSHRRYRVAGREIFNRFSLDQRPDLGLRVLMALDEAIEEALLDANSDSE